MTDDDIRDTEQKARAASEGAPGWFTLGNSHDYGQRASVHDHIRAASPDVVLALIERLRKAEAAIAKALVVANDDWPEDGCGEPVVGAADVRNALGVP